MLLYCVRHGRSSYNAAGRVQGQSDVPLSDFGRRQSEAVARALAGSPIDALYSSPLRRAHLLSLNEVDHLNDVGTGGQGDL